MDLPQTGNGDISIGNNGGRYLASTTHFTLCKCCPVCSPVTKIDGVKNKIKATKQGSEGERERELKVTSVGNKHRENYYGN